MSPLILIPVLILMVVAVIAKFAPRVGISLALVIIGVFLFLWLQFAGFHSAGLDRARKYGADWYPGFTYLCAGPRSQDAPPLAALEPPRSLGDGEVMAVASSSEHKVWFAGPPCRTQATLRMMLSWLALSAPFLYWTRLLIRRRKSHGVTSPTVSV